MLMVCCTGTVLSASVATVLIFSSVPVSVLKPLFLRFHCTGSCTSVLVPTSRYQNFGTRFSGDYLHLTHFGTGLVRFRFHFGSKSGNLKLWYWNLKCLKFFGIETQKLQFFRYFRFYSNTN